MKSLTHFLIFTFLLIGNSSVASSTAIYCHSFYAGSNGGKFLKTGINVQTMFNPGYEILDARPVISSELAKQLIDLLPKVGVQNVQWDGANFLTSYEIRIPKSENGSFAELDALPPEMGKPIAALIKEIEKEINLKFAATEGEMEFQFGIIRDFSRADLVGDFHTHQNGQFSATISLYGPGSVVAVDPRIANQHDVITAKTNQVALMTDGQRARKQGVPSTPHGSPKLKPGEQRLVLLVHFSLRKD